MTVHARGLRDKLSSTGMGDFLVRIPVIRFPNHEQYLQKQSSFI